MPEIFLALHAFDSCVKFEREMTVVYGFYS